MAWETQGPISDRAKEHLGESDRGIIMLRKLLREQIQAVQNGGDPIGINMDPRQRRSHPAHSRRLLSVFLRSGEGGTRRVGLIVSQAPD